MEKLNTPEQQDTEAEHSLSHLKHEVVTSEKMKQTTDMAVNLSQHKELQQPPEINVITQKILARCLSQHESLQKPLTGKHIDALQKEIYSSHPEIRGLLTFDLGINNLSCDVYDQLLPFEKIRLLALHGAMYDFLPLAPGLKNKAGAYDIPTLKKRRAQKVAEITQSVALTFQLDQWAHAGQILKTLQETYGLSEQEAQMYKQHLDRVTKEMKATLPEQGNMYGYVAAFVGGILFAIGGMIIYDWITNPKGMAENNLGEINLGDPSVLAKLVTAEQPFSVHGTRTESLYDSNDDTGLSKIAKDLINSAQSRTVTMSLDGKVAVEYDFGTEKGATFTYDPATKLINVQLPYPTFKIREQKATVLARNSEWFEVSKFNNTEQKLLDELNTKALEKAGTQQSLIDMSAQQTAKIVNAMYSPVLKKFNKEVIGVQVTIQGQPPKKFIKG